MQFRITSPAARSTCASRPDSDRIVFAFRKLSVLAAFLLLGTCASAQQIIFCESVGKDGQPAGISNTFSITPQGSFLNVLVKLTKPAGTKRIVYDLFAVDSLGKEKFESSTTLDVDPQWMWFNKGFTFFQPGKYAVYVYDDSERLIVAGTLLLVHKAP
jgi:hypothetical protein